MKKLLLCFVLLATIGNAQTVTDKLITLAEVETKSLELYSNMATELTALNDPKVDKILIKYLEPIVKIGLDYEQSKGHNEAKNKGR